MEELTQLFNDKIMFMNLPLEILEIKEFDKIYQVILTGRNNNYHNWPEHLNNLAQLMGSIDCWLINLENNVCDDFYYITIGVEK